MREWAAELEELWDAWKAKLRHTARYIARNAPRYLAHYAPRYAVLILLALGAFFMGRGMDPKPPDNRVDLFLFMGQSNMSGRGSTSEEWPEGPPPLTEGAGFEFRAVSDPTTLYPIAEPFGAAENRPGGIDDGDHKTGSMVTAFANAYYEHNTGHVPIVAVSASNSATQIGQWQLDGNFLPDALDRFAAAETYLTENGYEIRHRYMVWCQGENDGGRLSAGEYQTLFRSMLDAVLNAGIETCFLCRIGEYNGDLDIDYSEIIRAQTELCRENRNVVMATTVLCGMRARGLMKDAHHYYQAAYNEMGRYAGTNAALYANTGREPSMYDPKYDNLYTAR